MVVREAVQAPVAQVLRDPAPSTSLGCRSSAKPGGGVLTGQNLLPSGGIRWRDAPPPTRWRLPQPLVHGDPPGCPVVLRCPPSQALVKPGLLLGDTVPQAEVDGDALGGSLGRRLRGVLLLNLTSSDPPAPALRLFLP